MMVAVTMICITAAWALLGGGFAFRGGTTEPSTVWSIMNCVFGAGAGIAGGIVAAAVGKQTTRIPEIALAGLVLVLGLAMAVVTLGAAPSELPQGKTVEDLTFFEAGNVVRSPDWYNFTIPCIGAAAVLLGANFANKKRLKR